MRGATPASSGSISPVVEVLRWLACFPLLEEHHLQALVGTDAWTVREVVRELHGYGLAASLVLDSPEFSSPRRLYHLTDVGITALARALHLTLFQIRQRYPVGDRDLLLHVARAETAVGIAGFAASIAAGLRDDGEFEAVHIRSSHWTPQRGVTAVLPAVEAFGCFHAWGTAAAFAVAWDRAGAPVAHRRQRVAAWSRADDGVQYHAGRLLPSLLVVCPDEPTLQQWEIAVERSAARRARNVLPLHLATAREVSAQGPLGAYWRRPGGSRRLSLVDCLAWRSTASGCNAAPIPSEVAFPASRVERDSPRQDGTRRGGGRARARFGGPRLRAPRAERWAALAIELSATQKTLLEWVGHHPLLPATHLATHLGLSTGSVAGLLNEMAHRGLVAIERTGPSHNAEEPRHVLTAEASAFLAAHDGVPVGLYLREGVIAADSAQDGARPGVRLGKGTAGSVRLSHLRRHLEHTIGVQRFALTLAREAERQRALGRDHRLLAWLNDAEGQAWFRHDGRTHHIWPDARFRYRADDVVYDLLLEWDRGLVRRRDYARKFAAYAAYLTALGVSQDDQLRLIVVTTTAAAGRARAAVVGASQGCARLAAITRIITQDAVSEGRLVAALWPVTTMIPFGCVAASAECCAVRGLGTLTTAGTGTQAICVKVRPVTPVASNWMVQR